MSDRLLGGDKKVKPVSRFFILLLALLYLPGQISSQTTLTMVTEIWPPFRMEETSGMTELVGIDIDVLRQLEKRLGVTIEVKRHPWSRALEMMKNGQIDMITGIAYTEERALFMDFIPTSYYAVQPVFYALKGKGSAVKTYSDLYGKSIGQSKNSAYFDPYNTDGKLEKNNLTTEVQIIQMLALGRLDLAIGTDPNIGWDINRLGYGDVPEPVAYRPPAKTDLFIAFSKKSPAAALVPRVDEALKQMLADGTIAAIASKYRYTPK